MKFGVVFPTTEIGTDPVVIRDFAQAAESLGFSHVIVYDHVLGFDHQDRVEPVYSPYGTQDCFHEALTLLGFVAGATSTLGLMTGVLVSPQRQTALLAKQAAELAVLSDGRFRLGLGTGSNRIEYESLGAPFERRGRMLDEQVSLMRALWTEPLVDHRGEFHRVDRAALCPRPMKPIPIWFGGRSPAALHRAARIGDGFLFSPAGPPVKDMCRQLCDSLEENGRRPDFGIEVLTGFGDGPDHWHREIAAWEALGANALSIRTMSTGSALFGEQPPGFTSPRQHIDALAVFMNEVG